VIISLKAIHQASRAAHSVRGRWTLHAESFRNF
jgi:hypothetical protein